MEFDELRERLRRFAAERDWEQFHSPKNLASALAVEAAELLEPFQWLSDAESRKLSEEKRRQVAREIADVQIYLVRLADRLGIDILRAVERKLADNARRYPAADVKGSAEKRPHGDADGPTG